MSIFDKFARRSTRTTPVPRVTKCRVVDCDRSGYGGYCYPHTPDEGAGVIQCAGCGEPLADHSIDTTCYVRTHRRNRNG